MDFRVESESKSLFELFYSDKTKYGFLFQIMALQSRISNLVKVQEENIGKVLICERSFLSDYHIFAKEMHKEGHISDMEMMVYLKWYNYVLDNVKPRIDSILYLRAEPETCLVRVNKRSRTGEDMIDIEYLNKLHQAHEEWLIPRNDVLVVDANGQLDFNLITNHIESLIARDTGVADVVV